MMGTEHRSCVPAHHFTGNGNCDATREANKRADHQTGAAAAADVSGASGTSSAQEGAAMGTATGMESEIAPYTAAELQQMQSMGAYGQTAPYSGAEQDMIPDGYGIEHDHSESEEEGMTSIPQDSFNAPLNADEAARNSWRALLARNVGRNVLVRFLIGTQNMVTVEGELYEVGTDYIVIYQPLWDSHITADLYSVKFVEFREPPGVMTLA